MLWINLAGVALIAMIIWWFWLYKSPRVVMQDENVRRRVNR